MAYGSGCLTPYSALKSLKNFWAEVMPCFANSLGLSVATVTFVRAPTSAGMPPFFGFVNAASATPSGPYSLQAGHPDAASLNTCTPFSPVTPDHRKQSDLIPEASER